MRRIRIREKKKTSEVSTVVCLHSSASSSKQWGDLIDNLSSKYRVIAVDLAGYGKNQAALNERDFSLDNEVELIRPILESSNAPVHLVGHSYGAAVAIAAALQFPNHVKSLTVYEPVLFNLLLDDDMSGHAAREIIRVYFKVYGLVKDNCRDDAARIFINYWSGEKAWEFMPDWQRQVIMSKMSKVLMDFQALFGSSISIKDLKKMKMPVLYLSGRKSPLSTRRIAEIIASSMSNVRLHKLEAMGHLGPVTHAQKVNAMIGEFVEKNDRIAKTWRGFGGQSRLPYPIRTFPGRWNLGETSYTVVA